MAKLRASWGQPAPVKPTAPVVVKPAAAPQPKPPVVVAPAPATPVTKPAPTYQYPATAAAAPAVVAVTTPLPGLGPMSFDSAFKDSDTFPNAKFCTEWQTGPDADRRTQYGVHQIAKYLDTSSGFNPFSVKDGVLTIQTVRMPDGSYATGMLNTFASLQQKYGYFEASIHFDPCGKGLWPSFWASVYDGTTGQELDVVEIQTAKPNVNLLSVHGKVAGTYTDSIGWDYQIADASKGFVQFGVMWTPGKVEWFINRQSARVLDISGFDFGQSMYLILMNQVGSGKAGGGLDPNNGPPDQTTVLPTNLYCQYVRAWPLAR